MDSEPSCCRCLNPCSNCGNFTIYQGNLYCLDCYPEVMPLEFKKVVADLEEEAGGK